MSLGIEITWDKFLVTKGRGATEGALELLESEGQRVKSCALGATRRPHPPALNTVGL